MEKTKIIVSVLWLILIASLIWLFMFMAIATINRGIFTQAILVFCYIFVGYMSVIGLISLIKRKE